MDDGEESVALVTAPIPWLGAELAWTLLSEAGRRSLEVPQDGFTETLWTAGDTWGLFAAAVWVVALTLGRRLAP